MSIHCFALATHKTRYASQHRKLVPVYGSDASSRAGVVQLDTREIAVQFHTGSQIFHGNVMAVGPPIRLYSEYQELSIRAKLAPRMRMSGPVPPSNLPHVFMV